MDTLQRITAIKEPTPCNHHFFFNQIDDCLEKGIGFSLFNADEAAIANFVKRCAQMGFAPLTIRLSSLESILANQPALSKFVIIIQDLSYHDFIDRASLI